MADIKRDIIVIGASAGGVEALMELAPRLPADLPAALFVAIHLAAGYGSQMPELLTGRGPLRASHPVDGEQPSQGRIYVAPPDNHLMLRDSLISVARGPKENGHRPSVDALFRSASIAYGPRVIGVVLTGHLDCGTAGLLSIKARGGLAIVQDPREAKAPSMPGNALAKVAIDHVTRLQELPELLSQLTRTPVTSQRKGIASEVLELEGERLGAPAPLVCPTCQGVLTETQIGGFQSFRCHVGHAFSLGAVVSAQAESLERALWSAVRALEESAALSERLATTSRGDLRRRFVEREQEQRSQAEVIKQLLHSQESLSTTDATSLLLQPLREAEPAGES